MNSLAWIGIIVWGLVVPSQLGFAPDDPKIAQVGVVSTSTANSSRRPEPTEIRRGQLLYHPSGSASAADLLGCRASPALRGT